MDDHFQQHDDDDDIDRKPPPPLAAAAKKGPVKKRTRRKKSKKPKDMPRRPLSAYNIFFREERGRMLKAIEDGTDALEDGQSQGLFSAMGKSIAKKWKALSKEEMVKFTDAASEDLKRYRREMDEYQIIVTQRCRTDEEGAKVTDSPSRDEDDGGAALAAARNSVRGNHFDVPQSDFQQRGLGDYRDNPMRVSRPDVGPYSAGAGMGLGLPSQYGGMGGGSLLSSGQMMRSQGKFSDAVGPAGLMDSGSLLETSSQLGISAPQLVQYLQEEALKRHLQRERQLQLQILLQQQQQQQQPGSIGQLQDDYQGGMSNLLMQQQQQQSSRMSQPLLQQMLMQQQQQQQQQMSDMQGGRNSVDMGQPQLGRHPSESVASANGGGDGCNHQQPPASQYGGGLDQEESGGLHEEDGRQDI